MSRRKRLCVAVAGNSSFPLTPAVGAAVVDLLREYPEGTQFLTRGSPGFDEFVLRACEVLGLPCERRPSPGGRMNYVRDVEMVQDADEVVVFLDPSTITDERTGTSHVLDKALDQRKRTRAFSVAGDSLVYVGDSQP